MHIAIAGAGKLGLALTEALLGGGHSVALIDKDQSLLEKVDQELDLLSVAANAKDSAVLRDLKIQNYDHFIAATDDDEKNLVLCTLAKALGCPSTVARIRDPEHMRQLDFLQKTFRIDYIINPDLAVANAIYKYLIEKYTLSNGYLPVEQTGIIEFEASAMPELLGKSLMEASGSLPGMLVLAMDRDGKLSIPNGSTIFQENDQLFVIGLKDTVSALHERVHRGGKERREIRHVMIAGGGKTGYFLSKQLADAGVSVKLIETDRRRCAYLSENLENVLVLHGDATDPSLLEDENIDEMDAFVSATGFDEENLLLALLATQHNVEDVVAKVSHRSYNSLIGQMGVNALSPVDISASSVLRYIQGSKRILLSQQIQGQAEFIEILADENVKVLNTPLAKMRLPEGILLAAIQRGDQAIIPCGSTEILKGDRILVLCLLSRIPQFEQLFLRTRR